jgi:hypothetical protein
MLQCQSGNLSSNNIGMAAVEIRHALFHITGEAHVGSRAESVLHRA